LTPKLLTRHGDVRLQPLLPKVGAVLGQIASNKDNELLEEVKV